MNEEERSSDEVLGGGIYFWEQNSFWALDCHVIESIHEYNLFSHEHPYDTVRCAFPEGEEAYPTSHISHRLHIRYPYAIQPASKASELRIEHCSVLVRTNFVEASFLASTHS
jgi:hypothetical protein